MARGPLFSLSFYWSFSSLLALLAKVFSSQLDLTGVLHFNSSSFELSFVTAVSALYRVLMIGMFVLLPFLSLDMDLQSWDCPFVWVSASLLTIYLSWKGLLSFLALMAYALDLHILESIMRSAVDNFRELPYCLFLSRKTACRSYLAL